MGFLNVYNNFKDFNAHISHAFKVTFYDNIPDDAENVASFSVKSITKPVFKLSTEEYNRELGNSRFVIPIIDFSSAHMSITFYESDNMAVQAYLSTIYAPIGTVPPPIKILLEEFDNSMCIRLSSKVYLARLIELSLPGFNNDGPGSIQEITAEFNVMRVYDNLADAVKVKYGYKKGYEFKFKDDEFKIDTSSRKPSEIEIDNLTYTEFNLKKLQKDKNLLLSEYNDKMVELKKIADNLEAFNETTELVENKINNSSNLSNLQKQQLIQMLVNIQINEETGSVWTHYDLGYGKHIDKFEDLEDFVKHVTKKEQAEYNIIKGFGLSNITEDEIYELADLARAKNNLNNLKVELERIEERLTDIQAGIDGLNSDQGGESPAPAGGQGGNGGVPPGTRPELVNTGYHYKNADGSMGKEIKFDPPDGGKLHIRDESIKETVIGTSTAKKYRNMTKEEKIKHEETVIEKFSPIVLKIAKEKGIHEKMLPGMFAQMMLESGWLTSYDSTTDVNNFFGLTGAAGNTKSYVVSKTHEVAWEFRDKPKSKDRQVEVIRAFSQYDNAEDAIRDWLDRTVLAKRYQIGSNGNGGFQTGGWNSEDIYTYIKVMKNNGYATADTYIESVNGIIKKHDAIKNLKYKQ